MSERQDKRKDRRRKRETEGKNCVVFPLKNMHGFSIGNALHISQSSKKKQQKKKNNHNLMNLNVDKN
jgi:hypothetical protein